MKQSSVNLKSCEIELKASPTGLRTSISKYFMSVNTENTSKTSFFKLWKFPLDKEYFRLFFSYDFFAYRLQLTIKINFRKNVFSGAKCFNFKCACEVFHV